MPGVVSSWRTYVEEADDDDDYDEERAAARLSLMMCPQFSAVCRWRVFNAVAGLAIITAPLRLHLRKRVAVKDPRGCSFAFFFFRNYLKNNQSGYLKVAIIIDRQERFSQIWL
jgi:hypothetical protein